MLHTAEYYIEYMFKSLKRDALKYIKEAGKPNKEVLEKLKLLQKNSSNMIFLMFQIGYKPKDIYYEINKQLRSVVEYVEKEIKKEELKKKEEKINNVINKIKKEKSYV